LRTVGAPRHGLPVDDGFVIPPPKRKAKAYLRMARMGAKIWKEHGALAYSECVAEDLAAPFGMGFRRMARLKAGETVVFSSIVYRSRAHRDKVNAAVMKDAMPFDMKRFAMGGSEVMVAW